MFCLKHIVCVAMSTWEERINDIISTIIVEKKLYKNAVIFSPNYGRDTKKKNVVSYSIFLYEKEYPDYSLDVNPDKNKIAINFKPKSNKEPYLMRINYMDKRLSSIALPTEAVLVTQKAANKNDLNKDPNTLYVDLKEPYFVIDCRTEGFLQYIKQVIELTIDNYQSKANAFACCSKYVDCSSEKECLHENRLYSKACMYRKNLEAGKVFYSTT